MTDPKKQEIVTAPQTLPASPQEQSTAMIQMIKEVALSPNVNVEAMRAILEMQRQLVKDQGERAFNVALAHVAEELPRVKKSGKVEYSSDKTKKDAPKEEAFKFAKYEEIDKAIRPLLVKYGFSLSFTTEPRVGDGGGLTMVGILSHIEGHTREARLAVALDNSGGKNNIQGMGSSSTYGKRYVTCMLLNIITEGEDDDGNTSEPIDIEQAAKIDILLRESKADRKRFLSWLKVDDVLKIQRRHYPAAVKALEEKKAENEAAAKKGAA